MAEEQKTVQEIDVENMPLDELRALAQKEQAEPTEPEQQQTRDEQGRFVKQETTTLEEVDEVVYRREIDLGDGSGKQVFEAESLQGLVDKLATAQEHATKKIRELSAVAVKKQEQIEELPGLTADEKWALGQQLLADPEATIAEVVKKHLGMTLKEARTKLDRVDQRVSARDTEEAEVSAAQQFCAAHPEFVQNSRNAAKIETYIRKFLPGGVGTLVNIEKAYEDLSESGLLEIKDADAQESDNQATRIASTATTTTRRVASGISAKRTTPTKVAEPNEQELYDMPMDKLLALAKQS